MDCSWLWRYKNKSGVDSPLTELTVLQQERLKYEIDSYKNCDNSIIELHSSFWELLPSTVAKYSDIASWWGILHQNQNVVLQLPSIGLKKRKNHKN